MRSYACRTVAAPQANGYTRVILHLHTGSMAMNKLAGLALGLLVGILAGAALSILLSPQSGPELRDNLRSSYREALDEARTAGKARRAELESELRGMPRTPRV